MQQNGYLNGCYWMWQNVKGTINIKQTKNFFSLNNSNDNINLYKTTVYHILRF